MHPPQGITQKELQELAKLDGRIKRLEARRDLLKEQAKNSMVGLPEGTYIFGEVVITLNDAHNFNVEEFASTHPYDREPQYYTPAVDTAALEPEVKKEFSNVIVRRMSVRKAHRLTSRS